MCFCNFNICLTQSIWEKSRLKLKLKTKCYIKKSKRCFLNKVNALLDFKDCRIEISNTFASLDEEDMQPELYFKKQLAQVFCKKLKPNKPWFSKVMQKRSKDSQHPIKKTVYKTTINSCFKKQTFEMARRHNKKKQC